MNRTGIGILAGLAGLGMWWWRRRANVTRRSGHNHRGTVIYKNTPPAADVPGL